MDHKELRKLAERAYEDPHAFLVAGNHNVYGIMKLRELAKGTLELLDKKGK